jgi:hypothetical protein
MVIVAAQAGRPRLGAIHALPAPLQVILVLLGNYFFQFALRLFGVLWRRGAYVEIQESGSIFRRC